MDTVIHATTRATDIRLLRGHTQEGDGTNIDAPWPFTQGKTLCGFPPPRGLKKLNPHEVYNAPTLPLSANPPSFLIFHLL